jgi:hypothetical protein
MVIRFPRSWLMALLTGQIDKGTTTMYECTSAVCKTQRLQRDITVFPSDFAKAHHVGAVHYTGTAQHCIAAHCRHYLLTAVTPLLSRGPCSGQVSEREAPPRSRMTTAA